MLGLVGGFSGDSWPWQAVKEPQQMHRNGGEEGILQEQTSEHRASEEQVRKACPETESFILPVREICSRHRT